MCNRLFARHANAATGEKRRFWIPGSLAYDSNPNPELPKGMLVFDIELVRIQ